MAFRIRDKIIILEAGLTQAERNAQAPGKQHTTGQLIVCNPSIAACQRVLGLDPETDLTFFANPQGTYTLLDIFCGNFDAWADTVTNVYVGKGSDFFMCANTTSYGSYLQPSSNIPATQGTLTCFDVTAGIRWTLGGYTNQICFAIVNNCLVCCCIGTAYYYCAMVCSYNRGSGAYYDDTTAEDYCQCCYPVNSYITIS